VNEKKGRCFSPSAQKSTSIGFVHSKADDTQMKCKIALQSIYKYLQLSDHIQLQILCQIIHFLAQRTSKRFSTDINKGNFRSLL
jgi:hypothetical protein